jgi:hypothetical protein
LRSRHHAEGCQHSTITPLPLPTDNLYKFCALTGVVVIVLFIWQASTLKDEYAAKDIEFSAASKRFDIEKKPLEEALKKAREDTEAIKKDIAAGNPSPEKIKALELKTAESGRLVHEQQLRGIEFAATSSQLHLIMEHRIELLWEALFVLFGAGTLAVYGFKNWRRLQLKQDELLDLQLKEARGERATTKPQAGRTPAAEAVQNRTTSSKTVDG